MLNLSKNKISMIEGLRDLNRLRVLDLSYNRIFRIAHGMNTCYCTSFPVNFPIIFFALINLLHNFVAIHFS